MAFNKLKSPYNLSYKGKSISEYTNKDEGN